MKKILSAVLIMTIMISSVSVFALQQDQQDIASLLYELNIMKGDPSGDLRLDDYVTRAEFSKIAIMASQYKNSVATSLTISPFKDVPYSHWAAPYIKLAVTNKFVTGYPDSTFRPEDNVLFEEAVTIVLKLLGYTEDDFGSSWPYGQVGLGRNLELCDNISADIGSNMTRRDVMYLIYNLLNTKQKGGTANYIEKMNYKIVEDVILVATAKEDTSVGSDKVYTTSGTYKINSNFNYDNIGKKGDVVLKNTDEFVSFIPSTQTEKEYNIYQVLDNKIIVLEDGSLKTLDIDTNLSVYNKSQKTTIKDMLTKINPGDTITTFTNENGILDYGLIKTDMLEGPYTVHSSNWINDTGLKTSGLTVMRDGNKVSIDNISINDILYYSNALGIVWAYSKKVTGVYESATPNKDMPTSVTISGVSYNIEGVGAYNSLSSNGSFSFGDTVTLLLGRNGQIADVISPSSANTNVYGYMNETGRKDFKNNNGDTYSSYYLKIIGADGNEYEYATDRDFSSFKNSIVRLSFVNGKANISALRAPTDVYGKFDVKNKMLGGTAIASNINILDVTTTDKKEAGNYAKIYPQSLDGINLIPNNILFYEKNDKNEIQSLILNDFTGEPYKYGIMISASNSSKNNSVSGNYTYDINGVTSTLNTSSLAYSVESGQPIKISLNGTKITGITALSEINRRIYRVTNTYAETDTDKYRLSDNVVVYKKTYDFNYMKLPISEIIDSDKYNIQAYIDKPIANGGRVRIIIVTEKL